MTTKEFVAYLEKTDVPVLAGYGVETDSAFTEWMRELRINVKDFARICGMCEGKLVDELTDVEIQARVQYLKRSAYWGSTVTKNEALPLLKRWAELGDSKV